MQLSIIIPHKNTTSLLKRLLLSLKDIWFTSQIIVVDDHSNDKNLKELINLQTQFDFELYQSHGYGAGAARNEGLRQVKGRWVMFADADDYFIHPFAEKVTSYLQSDYDIVFFNVTSCYSETKERAYRDEHIKKITQEYLKTGNENYLRCCYTSPIGKLFKGSFLKSNHITFEEILTGNDMMFSIRSGVLASKIYYDSTEIYMITVSSGSLTTTLSIEAFESRFLATIRCNNYLRKNHKSLFQISVLYFIVKSYQFGFKYAMHVLKICCINRSNILIGIGKIFKYRKVLQDRQNQRIIIKK